MRLKDVVWLNKETRAGWNLAWLGLGYGNNVSLLCFYSHAAILVEIPAQKDREA